MNNYSPMIRLMTLFSPVRNNSAALVLPQSHQARYIRDHVECRVDHALPYAARIPQVKHVMELGRSRQHLDLETKVQQSSFSEVHIVFVMSIIICPKYGSII